jgi:hypothetical protein
MLISEKDMSHMKAFSPVQREAVMQKMMASPATEETVFEGSNRSVRALWRLRAEGLKLIDLQRQETAFTSVWYRDRRSLRNWQKLAAIVVWEMNQEQEVATFKVWRV